MPRKSKNTFEVVGRDIYIFVKMTGTLLLIQHSERTIIKS